MPIPEHERVPKKGPGRKPGQKSSSLEVMQRVVQVGKMMYSRGMGLTEIYTWNMDPARALHPDTGDPLPGGNPWGYSFTQIHAMCAKARKLGASLICKSYEEALRLTLQDFFDLKEAAKAGGDYKAAAFFAVHIAKMRDTYLGKMQKLKGDPTNGRQSNTAAAFHWAETTKALAAKAEPIAPVEFEDVTDQHTPPPSE